MYNAFPDTNTSREVWNISENRLIKMKLSKQLIEIAVHQKFHLDPRCFEKLFPSATHKSKYSRLVRVAQAGPERLSPLELLPKNCLKSNYPLTKTTRTSCACDS